MLKEKYASKVEELDVLRVELEEMKYRPSLLGACTSCPFCMRSWMNLMLMLDFLKLL
jgi:hypothetical protein